MQLTDFLKRQDRKEKASFHMPGHKGRAFFERAGYGDLMEKLVRCDITEIPGADDLRDAQGAIREICGRYADLYGSRRSFLSVNGSSAAIMAAVRTFVRPGRKLLAPVNCHVSVEGGARLAGAKLVSVTPDDLPGVSCTVPGSAAEPDGAGNGLGPVPPEKIEEALERDDAIDAVLITHPNYLGVMSDVEKIAELTHARGKTLIVDQAHGAHLKFFDSAFAARGSSYAETVAAPGKGEHTAAEDLGADLVIDSTHKTLASFTQSSVANVMTEAVDAEKYEQELLLLESTSPSYLLMTSLAVNAEILYEQGTDLIRDWIMAVADFRELYSSFAEQKETALKLLDIGGCDISKIVLSTEGTGKTAEEAGDALMEEGIWPEFASGNTVLLMTGIGTAEEDFDLLVEALAKIA